MAAAQAPKAVEVELADGRVATVREPKPTEFLRIMGVEIALVRQQAGQELKEGDEASVANAMLLLGSIDDEPLPPETLDDPGDYARLFMGLMQIMNAVAGAPLARKSATSKAASSSASRAAKAQASPSGAAS